MKYDVDTVGRMLPYADFRIRPYSLEETLTNVLSPFDYKFVKQSDKVYKLSLIHIFAPVPAIERVMFRTGAQRTSVSYTHLDVYKRQRYLSVF